VSKLPFRYQIETYVFLLPHAFYMPYASFFYLIISRREKIFALTFMRFSHIPATSTLIHKYSSQHLLPGSLKLCSSFDASDQVSHPYKTGKIIFWICCKEQEDKRFLLEFSSSKSLLLSYDKVNYHFQKTHPIIPYAEQADSSSQHTLWLKDPSITTFPK
jgi:hypothetical protein